MNPSIYFILHEVKLLFIYYYSIFFQKKQQCSKEVTFISLFYEKLHNKHQLKTFDNVLTNPKREEVSLDVI